MKTLILFGIAFLAASRFAQAAPPPQFEIQAKVVEMAGEGEKAPNSTLETPLPPKAAQAVDLDAPRVGVYTDLEFQVIIRALSQRKGTDLLSAPRVTTGDGQKAKVEVARAFTYRDEAGRPASKECGVIFTVKPRVSAGDQVDLDLSAQSVEFVRFETHPSGWKEPVFRERKVQFRATMPSGHTLAFPMGPKTEDQIVEETDGAGHVLSSKTVRHTIQTMVFVTARQLGLAPGPVPKAGNTEPRSSSEVPSS